MPQRGAFTLIELLVTLGIIALLAAILLPVIMNARRKAQGAACLSNVRQLGVAVLLYAQDNEGTYPPESMVFQELNDSGTTHLDKAPLSWEELLFPYTKAADLSCPARATPLPPSKDRVDCGYAYNHDLTSKVATSKGKHTYSGNAETSVSATATTVAVFDARTGISSLSHSDSAHVFNGTESIATDTAYEASMKTETLGAVRHNGGANYAFLDGHARWLRPADFVDACDGSRPCFQP